MSFTPGAFPFFLPTSVPAWRVVAAGTGEDVDGIRGGVQEEQGKRGQKDGRVFPQRTAESDLGATGRESLRE